MKFLKEVRQRRFVYVSSPLTPRREINQLKLVNARIDASPFTPWSCFPEWKLFLTSCSQTECSTPTKKETPRYDRCFMCFHFGCPAWSPEMWLKGVSGSDAKLVLIQARSCVSLKPLIFSSSIVCNADDRQKTSVNLWLVAAGKRAIMLSPPSLCARLLAKYLL